VPLNPERDGWHWICAKLGDPEPFYWNGNFWPGSDQWSTITFSQSTRYLGPCLTPAEVESHKYAAVIAYANLLNLPAPPNLIAQARRNALEEAEIAAKKAGERHQEIARRIGFEPTIDGAIGHACADIRALKGEGHD
jgi:hypothetical protein